MEFACKSNETNERLNKKRGKRFSKILENSLAITKNIFIFATIVSFTFPTWYTRMAQQQNY
jgi:hypothetical protein